jgi:hypothetical protein
MPVVGCIQKTNYSREGKEKGNNSYRLGSPEYIPIPLPM